MADDLHVSEIFFGGPQYEEYPQPRSPKARSSINPAIPAVVKGVFLLIISPPFTYTFKSAGQAGKVFPFLSVEIDPASRQAETTRLPPSML